MIFELSSKILFVGGLVFHNRSLATAHAQPEAWLSALDTLQAIDYKMIVPGHGEVAINREAIEQTRDYLSWLEMTIKQLVEQGLEMNEVLNLPIPERFQQFGGLKHEFIRSVSHCYPVSEERIFQSDHPADSKAQE